MTAALATTDNKVPAITLRGNSRRAAVVRKVLFFMILGEVRVLKQSEKFMANRHARIFRATLLIARRSSHILMLLLRQEASNVWQLINLASKTHALLACDLIVSDLTS